MRLKGDVAQQNVDLIRRDHAVAVKVIPVEFIRNLDDRLFNFLNFSLEGVPPKSLKSLDLHLKSETHLGLDAAGEDLQHQVDEALLEDAPVGLALAREGVEAVRDNAWEVDVLYEGHLVD